MKTVQAPAATLRPEAIDAWHRLGAALVDLTDVGRNVPCRIDPSPFTAEAPELRREAATACMSCPALEPCGAFAEANREPAHVWGGVDRSPGSKQTREAA